MPAKCVFSSFPNSPICSSVRNEEIGLLRGRGCAVEADALLDRFPFDVPGGLRRGVDAADARPRRGCSRVPMVYPVSEKGGSQADLPASLFSFRSSDS